LNTEPLPATREDNIKTKCTMQEGNTSSHDIDTNDVVQHEEEYEPSTAVLFPWFVEALGLFVFFILSSRWIKWLPYTAVMFVLGVAMGLGAERTGFTDTLSESIEMWSSINSEVLFAVFLPGLLFKDALQVNFHLFTASLSQILLLAFPMVLTGTCLTACVAYYIFPYGWSWNLAMTFGSILAATDPVAVAALLGEVGAPPRLTMHISGESMFNDGSAMVFFDIFARLFLNELNIDGLGDTVSIAEGFKAFFRLSLGGIAIGIAFSLGLIFILYRLDKRLNNENNVVQVAATVTTAYICFYTSEVISGCSGIIAVVICGITTAAFGGGFINNNQMMEDFWGLLEHLLNTLLFTLGGAVWGSIIANTDEREDFAGFDWGYLVLLYIFVIVIRAVCLLVFYPVFSNIGMETNWQESVFMCWGGLRGAVGIALAISLDNSVRSATDDEEARNLTSKVFGMVGGVAFLTLVVNGTTAGPVLKKLGLAKSSETHKKIFKHYNKLIKRTLVQKYAHLVTDYEHRFKTCTFNDIRYHVPYLKDVPEKEVELAIKHAKERKSHRHKVESDIQEQRDHSSALSPDRLDKTATFGETELRLLFLELLRGAFESATREGFLDARIENGFLHYILIQSIEFARDSVNRGGPIVGWEFTEINKVAFSKATTDAIERPFHHQRVGKKHQNKRIAMLKAYVFQDAHRSARKLLREEFADDAHDELKKAASRILSESEKEEQRAIDYIESIDQQE